MTSLAKTFDFRPLNDITALELANCMAILLEGNFEKAGTTPEKYITEKGIRRHFVLEGCDEL